MSATTGPRHAPAPISALPRIEFLDLLLGLPALIVGVALVLVLVRQGRRTDIEGLYVADAMARQKELVSAASGPLTDEQKIARLQGILLDYRRLVAIDPTSENHRVGLALTLEGLGQLGRAESLMRGMAPSDGRVGYLPAHLWLATRLSAAARNPAMRLEAVRHYKAVLTKEPDHLEARLRMADQLALTGQYREARTLLEEVVGKEPYASEPTLLLNLANICRKMNDQAEARRLVDRAEGLLRTVLARQPGNWRATLFLAMTSEWKGDYRQAVRNIEQGATSATSETARQSISLVYATWFDDLKRTGATADRLLEVAEEALARDPENSLLLGRLAELIARPGPAGQKALARFEDLRKQGRAPGLVEFVLGNEELRRGNPAQARAHWEKSIEVEKSNRDPAFAAYTRNNLAFALAYFPPVDPDRALKVIDEAVRLRPQDLMLRGTRGQILTKLKRYQEARAELEHVVAQGPTSAETHKALAEAYDHLGLPDQAALEESRAALAVSRQAQSVTVPLPTPSPQPPMP